jgi:carbonic anhydrase/acetyltransferase-like protein (isoleucine patch superfamily)
MLRRNSNKDYPQVDKSSYVDPQAILIGKIKIGKNVFIAPGAVIRADEPNTSISINDNCNIQDRVVIHALGGSSVRIDKGSSLSHGCIVHGPCIIGGECFIGFGSVVFKSVLADRVFVGHLAVVEGVAVPKRRHVPSGSSINHKNKTKSLKLISQEQDKFIQQVIDTNMRLAISARRSK